MRNDTANSRDGRHSLQAVERTRSASTSQEETPALVAARARLRQIAEDLRRNRQEVAALARGLRTTGPSPGNSYACPNGPALSVEEWAADCADVVAEGLVGLAELAETFARADWHADVMDWLDATSRGSSAAGSRN